MKFEENPSNERRFTGEKVVCSSSKVPFIIHRSNQTYTVSSSLVDSMSFEFRGKSLHRSGNKPKRNFALHVMCP